jgi:serine/threonine protein kinase
MSMDNYDLLEELGRGTFGVTYKAYDKKLNRIVAIKTIKLKTKLDQGSDIKEITDEIDTLKHLSRAPKCFKYIACYYESFGGMLQDPFKKYKMNDTFFIVSEFIDGTEFGKFLLSNPLDKNLNNLITIMVQLSLAVAYVHWKGYAHRDLKPANIMVSFKEGRVKLIDFGIACKNKCYAGSGTILYMPPETYSGVDIGIVGAQAHDVWSLGVIFYQMTNQNKYPFDVNFNDFDKFIMNLNKKPLYSSNFSGFNDPAANIFVNNLIAQMLNKKMQYRITMVEVLNKCNELWKMVYKS